VISFVIPTYNEESYIEGAIHSIRDSCKVPFEIIVADNSSNDRTREIAEKNACRVVEGGLPSVGRNSGARAAKHEYLVFLDADSRYNHNVESAIAERLDTHDVLTFAISPLPSEKSLLTRCCCRIANSYISIRHRLGLPIGWGACLFVKRSTFEESGGFREDLLRFEDFEFSSRVAKFARYEHIGGIHIETSSRRLTQAGLMRYALLCAVPEFCRHVVGWPTRKSGRWMGYDDWHAEG
jgi:glycosyltransferase involved in cell wall biosynthesis